MNYFDATFNVPKTEISKSDLRFELRVSSNKGFKGSTIHEDCWDSRGDMYELPLAWALAQGLEGEDRTPRIKREWPEVALSYRHNQEEVITKAVEHLKEHRCSRIKAGTGWGKCHDPDQKVIMYSGEVKKISDLKIGDQLMGPDSKPRNVIATSEGFAEMVEIIPKRGKSFKVTKNHIIPVKEYIRRQKNNKRTNHIVKSEVIAGDWDKLSNKRKHCYKLWKPDFIHFPKAEGALKIPPYILGIWLGDGTAKKPSLTTMDYEVSDAFVHWGRSLGCNIRIEQKPLNKAKTFFLKTDRGESNPFTDFLRELNLWGNKHIPKRYLLASKQERLDLFAGLMDTDGNWNTRGCNFEITQAKKVLADQILFLSRSLGYAAQMTVKIVNGVECYKVAGSYCGPNTLPVRVSRKTQPIQSTSNMRNTGFKVVDAGIGPFFGVETDGDHLYLLDDFTVTHNSVAAIDIARRLETNALIVVPTKEIFKQFVATATDPDIFGIEIDQIKGKNKLKDKLVTVTTYQTLARRCEEDHDYFDKFGLLVIDEAHLSGCPSFKKILHKINATWRLSVSADFYRADKLEGVYPIYLGEVAAVGKKDPKTVMDKMLWAPEFPVRLNMRKCTDRFGDFSQVAYNSLLAENLDFNNRIAEIAERLIADGDRRVLIGLKRLIQADILEEILGTEICGKFTGSMKDDDLSESARKDIILYSKSDLGFDMSKFLGKEEEKKLAPLNTGIIPYPTNNSLQFIGRVGRENRGAKALIVHIRLPDFYSRSAFKKCSEKVYKDMKKIMTYEELK
jgi:hypothetical protein